MRKYPSNFPGVLIEGYGIEVDMGLVRTGMELGITRQRRRYRTMPQMFTLNFAIPIQQMDSWQLWVDGFAYDWFELPLASYLTGITSQDKDCSPHVVRFISDLAIVPFTPSIFGVSVAAEMVPATRYSLPAMQTNEWIIAGSADDPSADWVIAGSPSSPSTDWVVSGSPNFPAAII